MLTVTAVLGTRPEAIKLFPVIDLIRRHPERYRLKTVATGQHCAIFNETAAALGLEIDINLGLQNDRQTLNTLSAAILSALDRVYGQDKPDLVLVQGDTQSALMGAMAAAFRRIPVAHVEAGLRTGNKAAPFPEELNRQVIAALACLHFAPTARAKHNLLREGIDPASIIVTGNTVIDSLKRFAATLDGKTGGHAQNRRRILVTCHRRESWEGGIAELCTALSTIANTFRDVDIHFILPVAPQVRERITAQLCWEPSIKMSSAMPYPQFLKCLLDADLVMTDSGGVQEEAPSFGIPTVVLRNESDRPEALADHDVVLAGTSAAEIYDTVVAMLRKPRQRNPHAASPYGDGMAAARILSALDRWQLGKAPLLPAREAFPG